MPHPPPPHAGTPRSERLRAPDAATEYRLPRSSCPPRAFRCSFAAARNAGRRDRRSPVRRPPTPPLHSLGLIFVRKRARSIHKAGRVTCPLLGGIQRFAAASAPDTPNGGARRHRHRLFTQARLLLPRHVAGVRLLLVTTLPALPRFPTDCLGYHRSAVTREQTVHHFRAFSDRFRTDETLDCRPVSVHNRARGRHPDAMTMSSRLAMGTRESCMLFTACPDERSLQTERRSLGGNRLNSETASDASVRQCGAREQQTEEEEREPQHINETVAPASMTRVRTMGSQVPAGLAARSPEPWISGT